MIVDTMNRAEVLQEILKDRDEIYRKVEQENKRACYRKFFINQQIDRAHYFPPVQLHTKRGNSYLVILYAYGKSDYKKNGPCFYVYNYHFMKGRFTAVMLNIEQRSGAFITSHLLDRYAERYLKTAPADKLSTLAKYAINNSVHTWREYSLPKYESNYFAQTKEGVILGDKIDGIYICKTFITFEMLKGKEIELRESGLQSLNKYIEFLKTHLI